MRKSTLLRIIEKTSNTVKLNKLKNTGLDKIVADSRVVNFIEADKVEVVTAIDARLSEMEDYEKSGV